MTYLSTVRKYPESLLGAMFSQRNEGMLGKCMGDDGCYFFDRDPNLFEIILNFYRCGNIISISIYLDMVY